MFENLWSFQPPYKTLKHHIHQRGWYHSSWLASILDRENERTARATHREKCQNSEEHKKRRRKKKLNMKHITRRWNGEEMEDGGAEEKSKWISL